MKLSDPVRYFGSDLTHMRSEPWHGQADFNEESLFRQLRMGHEHTCRGHSGPSLTSAVDTERAPFGHPGPLQGLHPGPLHFFIITFFRSVEKYQFDSPEVWGLFIHHRGTAEVEIFLTRGCIPGAVQHRWPRRQHAGVWGSVCCTCHSPMLLVWGVLCRIQHPHHEVIQLFFFWTMGWEVVLCLFVLVIIPLGWIEAELSFSSAARHDGAAGSCPRAELSPLFLPNVH